jgi:hypothetical protein
LLQSVKSKRNRINIMILNKSPEKCIRAPRLTAALGLFVLIVAGQASAACMDGILHQESPTKSSSSMHLLLPAVDRSGDMRGALLLPTSDTSPDNNWQDNNSIVGLWQFKFDGFSPDWGTQAWHSDGTEILFSGGQNPETGDVCQGVWRKVGPSIYSLNHIAMGWTVPGGVFGIRVHIHALVRLDRSGNSYFGKYKAAVYSVSPADPFDESVQIASGTGNVTGTRVLPD